MNLEQTDLTDLDLPPDVEQLVQSALADDIELGGRYDREGFVAIYGSISWPAYVAATAAG